MILEALGHVTHEDVCHVILLAVSHVTYEAVSHVTHEDVCQVIVFTAIGSSRLWRMLYFWQ